MREGLTTAKARSGWHCATGIAIVVVGSTVASWAAMVLAVDAAGGPPEHNAGASFANLAGLMLTCAATLALGLSAFGVAWSLRRSQRRALFSTMVGLTPGVLAIAVVPWLWTA